ncbi:MAG: APC family permease [Streptosporangiaceae bacterium]|nr:APC family permease [Streptosporangiaceae bacterium]MBV9858398.1 APC family permease [Streptosporangiaceae bacterium]
MTAETPVAPGLRRNAIGLREVLFQSITDMAPGAAIAASIPAGALYAGGALPLAVLFALIACLLCASCIGLLAREMPAAGSLATYAARGLHPAIGFLTAWGYVLVGVLISPLVLLQLGFTTASTINSEFAGYPATLWWPWSLAGAVIVLAAGFYGIRTSARLGTVLGVSEIAVFLVLAVFLIVHAGSHNTWSVFGSGYTPKGFRGISGVIAGSVYSLLAFGGFEGAAPLAEEARDPRRTVQRAVLLATLGIGLLYVLTTYAADVAFGPAGFAGFGASGSASWVGLARSLYGIFWFFVFLAIVNSTVANANAGVNVSSRTAYAMGRIRAFPHVMALVHHKHRSPVAAIFTTFVLTVAIMLGLGFAYNPTNAFAMVGTGIVIVLVAIYILMNAACIGYFASARNRAGRRWNPLLHLIIPLLGIAALVPAWLTSAGIRAFSFVAPLTAPSSYMGPGVAGFMVVGLLYLLYLHARHPRRVTEVGLVHIDEPVEAPAQEAAR